MVRGFVPPEDNGMLAASNGIGFRVRAHACIALLVAVAAVVLGCGPAGETGAGGGPTGPAGGSGGDGGSGGGGDGCMEGSVRDCHITLGQHDNVLSCFDGVQTCKGGAWGACVGEEAERPAPPPVERKTARKTGPKTGGQHTRSLSMHVDCLNNPCDPTCQTFDEIPGTPVASPGQILIAPWQVGSYGDLPEPIPGVTEPCDESKDCQFDQYCYNPTSGTCSHHKCSTGVSLVKGCDACVKSVCESGLTIGGTAMSSCCSTAVPGNPGCGHDLCEVGAKLTSGCDPCVTTICSTATYAHCCTTEWTAGCVERAKDTSIANCGKTCSTADAWNANCVAAVPQVCNTFCAEDQTAPLCAHDKCYTGAPLDAACDSCVAQICSTVDATCCNATGAWNGQCVQAVASLCGETCPAKGTCVPWLPTQYYGAYPCQFSADLTVGVGCTSGGSQQVPVCNRGGVQAPGGIPIVVFPGAVTIGDCYPNIAALSGTTIYTTVPIDAGDCINVTLPVGTPDGAYIQVNPSTAIGSYGSECRCSNNWSIFQGAAGSCATPDCTGASATSKLKNIKIFFTVDTSDSMRKSVSTGATPVSGAPAEWPDSRIKYLRDALNYFVDNAPVDTGVWLRFWPKSDNGGCPAAWPSGCSPMLGCKVGPHADVPDLTDVAPTSYKTAIKTQITNVTAGSSQTQTYPALDGALRAAADYQAANLDTTAVVVLVTDGDATFCYPQPDKLAALSDAAFNSSGVRTYVIGIDNTSPALATAVKMIAGAGGGKSFFISTNNQAQFQTELQSALVDIKNDFVSCTFSLPNDDIFDPAQATVTYAPGAGGFVSVPGVADLGSCGVGDGWYYDDPADPTSMTLCPATCTSVKNDSNGEVTISIDCITQYLPSQYKQTYEAECPKAGTIPQWGFLAYNTLTPGDSRVEFRVHTSDTLVFGALPASAVKTAQAVPDTQVCAMAGPSPCPVDLYEALGLPDAHAKYLELVMDVYPTSDTNQTPQINDWQVTYSCPDAE